MGPDRKPIGGAEVIAISSRPEFHFAEDLLPLGAARTDAQGVFELTIPTTSGVELVAFAKGMRRARFALVDLPRGYGKVGIALEGGAKIEGVVLDAANAMPIPNAIVGPVVFSPDEELALASKHVPVWTTTDANGRFSVEGLMPNRAFQFLVKKEGYQLENVSARAGTPNVVVRLSKGGSRIEGEIASSSRPPHEFAGTRLRLNGNGFNDYTVADSKGRFVLTGLPPGNFSLEAIVESPRVSQVVLLEFPRDNGKQVRLNVSEGYWMSGNVFDATTSAPADGVVLRVEDKTTTSAPDGSFRLGPLWTVGRPHIEIADDCDYVLSAAPVGALVHYGESDGFRNIEGETVWVRPTRRLNLKINHLEATTQPVSAMFVGLDGKRFAERMTSQVQRWRMRSVSPGFLWATDQASWSSTIIALVDPPKKGEQHVQFELTPAAELRGRVVRLSGSGATTVPRTLIKLYPALKLSRNIADTPAILETVTTPDGLFRFPCVPPGSYRVVVTNDKATLSRVYEMQLAAGQVAELNAELPVGKRFTGLVRDTNHQSLGGVQIRYYVRKADTSTQPGLVETGPDGRFALDEIDGVSLALIKIERQGYAPWQKNDVALPCEDLEIVLTPVSGLPFRIQADPSRLWRVFLMRIDLWGSGTYAKQLIGREVAMLRVVGGAVDAFPTPDAGRYRIVAANDDGTAVGVSEEFVWEPAQGRSTPLDVVVGATGKLVAEFENASLSQGELVATNMVIPESLSAAEHRVTQIAGDAVTVEHLVPGDYLVLVSDEGFSANAINVRIEPGKVTTIKLKPMQLGTLQGQVKVGTTPVASAHVVIKSQTDEGREARTATTDASGRFQVDGLSPDLYIVEVTGPTEQGERTGRQGATIPPEGGVVEVSINLAPPPRISFTLPESFAVPPGTPISLLSRETGETVIPEWKGAVLEATISPGIYHVSQGDAPLGTIRINSDGQVEVVE